MSLVILHRRRKLQLSPVNTGGGYVDNTGLLYGYSFRQLNAGATYALRQYSDNNKTTFQDVGFVNGYVDFNSITSFANGTRTYLELYNQVTNTLDFTRFSTRQLGSVTNDAGELFLFNGKVYYEAYKMSIKNLSVTDVNVFLYADQNQTAADGMVFGASGNKWFGVGQDGNTGGVGSGTYYKDGVLISPNNRDIFWDAQFLSGHHLLSIRTAAMSGITELIQGYNVDTVSSYMPNKYQTECLIYDAATQTGISTLETNIMNTYS